MSVEIRERSPEEKAARLTRAEADIYRKALIRLFCDATSGKRSTMDKAEIEQVCSSALEQGNLLSRRSKEVS